MAQGRWWTVALTEHLGADKALPVVCEQEQLALFRNRAGEACAVEDRCPHRRVLLSPGVIVDGRLRCPYHGWTFDGKSGQCTDIPNLRRDERIGDKYAVVTYRVVEKDGFVHVWRGSDAPSAVMPKVPALSGKHFTGAAVAGIAYAQYLDVMLDGMQCLIEFCDVQITDFFLGDPRREGEHLILDRGAVWKGKGVGPAFVRDHPLIVRTSVPTAGGVITVLLLDAEEKTLASVALGANENRRGTTSLCWRAAWGTSTPNGAPLRWRLRRASGQSPVRIKKDIDGAALAAVEVAPSLERRPLPQRERDAA